MMWKSLGQTALTIVGVLWVLKIAKAKVPAVAKFLP